MWQWKKKYTSKCERCDFFVGDNKKYGAVQMILKHKKEGCIKKSTGKLECEQCEFKANDKIQSKRHMRDVHEIGNASTSPPPKRKRRTSVDQDDDNMEIEDI
jgi:hypothetical protein